MTTYEALSILAQFCLTIVATLTQIISVVVIIRKLAFARILGECRIQQG